ncbi:MAG: 3'-5' exonuclease, partial [bacterium]
VTTANDLARGLGMSDQTSKRDNGTDVEVMAFSSPVEQSIKIAEEVAEARENGELGGNFAVLVRTNAQSAPVESAFVAKGLPYFCNGGGFFDRMEVGDIMAYLRIANDSSRTDLLERIINRPTRFLGKAFVSAVESNLSKYGGDLVKAIRFTNKYSNRKLSPKQREGAVDLSDLLLELREGDINLSPVMAINRILAETDYIEWLRHNSGLSEDADSQRLDNIEALKVEAARFISIADFLHFADESSRLQIDSKDSTQILTVHRAKGLEWDTVWVTNFHDESIPHAMSKREGDIVSEKRVAYVAFTRAENNLKIGVPRTDEKGNAVEPSRFLKDAGLEIPA